MFSALTAAALAAAVGCFSPAKPTAQEQQEREVEVPLPEQPPPAPPVVVESLDQRLREMATRELLVAVDSQDARLRCQGLEALQDVAPDEAIDPAISALTDPDPTVRFAACMAVGELRIKEAHAQLQKMHDNSDEPLTVQVGVRFALHRLGDYRYSHDLETYARDTDAEVRGKTAEALGLLGEPSAVKVLRPMRRDAEPSVRLQAAESLWRLKNTDGLDDLLAYAISKYPDDLILATLALAAPKDPEVIQHVRANLVADYPEVELAAARAMGELGSDEGYTIAMRGSHSADTRQRSLAALALGAIGRSDAQGTLADLLKDPNVEVRLSAATALLQLQPAPK